MEIAIVIIAYILTNILIVVNINKFMHIFQQSFYQIEEFTPALKTTGAYKIQLYEIVLLVFSALSFISSYFLILYVFFAIFVVYKTINNRPVAKKKFVYTSRVKITYSIIALILITFTYLVCNFSYFEYINFVFIILSLYKYVAIGIMLLGNVIALPILKLLNYHYIKEAKNIINENKKLKVIAITGSYGKTSTKNIVNSILEEKYISVMTPKSFNTTLGVVRAIRELVKPYTEVFVCEMGASKLKDIEDICKIVKPDISVITTIGPQHLTTFKSMENIEKGKFEIITNAKEDAIAVLNIDNEYIQDGIKKYVNGKNVIKYSINNKEARYTVEDVKMSDKGSIFTVCDGDSKFTLETRLLGKHNIYNILCAVAIAKELNMTNEEIKKAVKKIKPVEHPEGSKTAIDTLCMFKDKYKVMVTPGMIELGEKTDELNKKLGEYATVLDYVILVGDVTTKKIEEGMKEKGYSNYIVVKDLYEAFRKLEELQVSNTNLLALFENDLPDSYIK